MPKISDSVEVQVEVTPHELGRIFARMDSDEQAQFFEGIATEAGTWPKAACFQWEYVRGDLEKYPRGLECFKGLAEYAD